jgi:anthranilate phosphoribosyltransferase
MSSEMSRMMKAIMGGQLQEAEIINFLSALQKKKENQTDLFEAAKVMRDHALKVPIEPQNLLDTCGTGGDGLHTLNVSTLAALIASAAGVPVAKHGNRSVTGVCGSADLLKALGFSIECSPQQVADSIKACGFGFMFAPVFHPAMKYAASARKKIKERTIFNCLGPLTNPAGAKHHLMGVYAKHLVKPLCQTLGNLGAKHAIVVHGEDGLDEISISGKTWIAEWNDMSLREYSVIPADFGLARTSLDQLRCDSLESSLALSRQVLDGQKCAARDFVLLNAAFALKAADVMDNISEGIKRCAELIDGGEVLKKIEVIKNHLGK